MVVHCHLERRDTTALPSLPETEIGVARVGSGRDVDGQHPSHPPAQAGPLHQPESVERLLGRWGDQCFQLPRSGSMLGRSSAVFRSPDVRVHYRGEGFVDLDPAQGDRQEQFRRRSEQFVE